MARNVVFEDASVGFTPDVTGHRVDQLILAEPKRSTLDFKSLPGANLELRQKRFGSSHDAVAAVLIANRDWNRLGDSSVGGELLIPGVLHVPRRSIHVEDGVEHQLEFAPPRADHEIVAERRLAKPLARLGLKGKHSDDHRRTERDRPRRQDRAQLSLRDGLEDYFPDRHNLD